jgi:hypothetical protein
MGAASARRFGFSSWSLLLPSVCRGVAAVWILMATVRRPWGRAAGAEFRTNRYVTQRDGESRLLLVNRASAGLGRRPLRVASGGLLTAKVTAKLARTTALDEGVRHSPSILGDRVCHSTALVGRNGILANVLVVRAFAPRILPSDAGSSARTGQSLSRGRDKSRP